MYINLVGGEDVVLRARNASSGYYDQNYTPPMPMIAAPDSNIGRSASTDVSFIIDTGADLTLLRGDVADKVDLWNDAAGRLHVAGIGGVPALRQLYNALVEIAGETVLVTADCRDDIDEDILGRDAINEFALTLCAKRDQVVFERVEAPQA